MITYMLTVIPECTFANEEIAVEETGAFKEIGVAQDCSCLPCSEKCSSRRICAVSADSGFMWIYWCYSSEKEEVPGPAKIAKMQN